MECRFELKKGSSDRPPFVAADKKVFTKEGQRSFPPDKFRDDKRGLSYSDFHREITKKVEDVCPKRLENRLKSRIARTASGERDIVKYKSYVPSYIKKFENLEEKGVKAGGIGSQDLLRNRLSGHKQIDKHTKYSLSNTSTSSSLWTDESSSDSSRGLHASPFRKKINNPPLQYYLISSKPGDCSQDFVKPRDNGDTSQSHSSFPGNNTDRPRDSPRRRNLQFHQSPRGTAFLQDERKDSDFRIVPKTRSFLSPSKPDNPSCTRIISKNVADDFKKNGVKLDERIRNPRVHDLFGKEKPAAVFVPGIVSEKQITGLSKFYDSKVLLAERMAETNRKGLQERSVCEQGVILDSDVDPFRRESDGRKPFLKRINFLNTEKNRFLSERSRSAPRSRKVESSPSRSRTLDRRSTETLPKQSDQKSARVVTERARSISPFRRLSFSIGKSSKNSNVEDAQTLPHLTTTLKSSRAGLDAQTLPHLTTTLKSSRAGLDNPSTSSISDGSSFDNTITANRGRSSPLRRLLEPLIKSKSSHICKSPEPSLKGDPSTHQKHIFSDGQPSSSILSRNGKSSTIQALFRVTSKNDQPLFTFAVDREQSITAATVRKQIGLEREDYGHKYTFFTVQEVHKKNGKWMNPGRKVQSQEYTSNIVAQMRVSSSKTLNPTGISSVDNLITRESVLFTSESQQRTMELAAMVIKIPNTSSTTLGDYFGDINATVVLPSGIHSLPHKGGPSSLIQRWKSGGSCDCGGWDMCCNLRILTNQYNKPRNLSPSTSEAFKLFLQGGLQDKNNQPFLSFTPYREGVYAVEYNSSSLSLLQAFSICISVNEGLNPLKTVEPNTSRADKTYGEMSSSQTERLKSFSGPIEAEAPAKYLSHPPLSPVGRV